MLERERFSQRWTDTEISSSPSRLGHENFWTSDPDSGNVMTSNTDTSSDKGMFENLGHGLGHL